MIEAMILILALLQLKHWYIDFVNQSNEEIASKGIYGDTLGLSHSIKHGAGTLGVLVFVLGLEYLPYIIILSLFDFITHYHIDWVKMNYGSNDMKTKEFWNHLGLDQMAHQLTYLFIAYSIC